MLEKWSGFEPYGVLTVKVMEEDFCIISVVEWLSTQSWEPFLKVTTQLEASTVYKLFATFKL